jgi:hypothetical protein
MKIEYTRYFPINEARAEFDDAKDRRTVSGYAAVFASRSELIGGMFLEEIAPGAFRKTLQEGDPVMVWSHDTSKPLARRSNASLALKEDERGLWFEADLGATTWGDDAYSAISTGLVTQMSFGFEVMRDEWLDGGDMPLRIVRELKLYEVSPVVFPAYPATEVQARSVFARSPLNESDDLTNRNTSAPGPAPHPDAVRICTIPLDYAKERDRVHLALIEGV